mgnify:CR=1 FL=1|tara:strand:+ start:444 stop:674 length:231 start_codon:yes stop_codon:yes gene_type:complete
MTRSRRKTPITGMTCNDSEKQDKRLANRKLRAAERAWLTTDMQSPDPVMREVDEVATHSKDGKQWLGDRFPELMRK